MSGIQGLVGKHVSLELSGKIIQTGLLVDLGLDLMVLRQEQRFYYIPLVHVQSIKEIQPAGEETEVLPELEQSIDYGPEGISFRKILNQAKGIFVEIYVTGNKSVHGYLTSIMNDYFVFYSPVHKAMFVSMNHLKWLAPYYSDQTPYSLDSASLPLNPVKIALSRTFEDQCKKLQGHIVVFDLGDNPDKTGLLQKADNQTVRLVTASGDQVCWNMQHLKTIGVP